MGKHDKYFVDADVSPKVEAWAKRVEYLLDVNRIQTSKGISKKDKLDMLQMVLKMECAFTKKKAKEAIKELTL